eukprot:SAG22_NODE_663_length_8042_cov_12.157371_6_plen_358_part_00
MFPVPAQGKYRQDQRQRMFTSNAERFEEQKQDGYHYEVGPGSYPGAGEKIVAWGGWDTTRRMFETHRHGTRWQSNGNRFYPGYVPDASQRPNVNPLSGDHWDNTLNIRLGKAERFPQRKSEEYKKKIGPGTYDVRKAHTKLLDQGRIKNKFGSVFTPRLGEPRVDRNVRHGDPAEMGPGSYDVQTPDEVSQQKYEKRPDPTIAAHEIQTAPRIERIFRHGDPSSLGPGSYNPSTGRPRTADEPGRPSSAFAAPGRGSTSFDAAHEGAAKNVVASWKMAHDASKWVVGGDTGATAGSFSSSHRFESDHPHALPAWRSEYTSRQILIKAIARHEELKAKDRRARRRKGKKKWRPVDDSE